MSVPGTAIAAGSPSIDEAGSGRGAGSAGTSVTGGAAGGLEAGVPTKLPTSGSSGSAGAGGTGADAGLETPDAAGAPAPAGRGGMPSAGASALAGTGGMSGSAATSGSSGMGSAGTSATPRKKFSGNITTGGKVRPDFVEYWDQITPENEGKWGSVERVRDEMSWSALDAAYDYARQHEIPFKQHTFVWGSQQPTWLGSLSQSEQRAEVEEWIRLYCERYPETQLIDVVNEPPPHTTPVYTAALGGAGASGYDWIVQAFKWARQYCPNAILILNDYNTIEYANDNSHFIDIVMRIKAAGAPIDAVGAQAHAAYKLPTATVKMFVDKLASSTGLPVYISEYDIDLADDSRQRSVMESQFTMFWNNDHVAGITLWGYIEGQTWLPNSGLMTTTGQKRPAMTWLLDYLEP